MSLLYLFVWNYSTFSVESIRARRERTGCSFSCGVKHADQPLVEIQWVMWMCDCCQRRNWYLCLCWWIYSLRALLSVSASKEKISCWDSCLLLSFLDFLSFKSYWGFLAVNMMLFFPWMWNNPATNPVWFYSLWKVIIMVLLPVFFIYFFSVFLCSSFCCLLWLPSHLSPVSC